MSMISTWVEECEFGCCQGYYTYDIDYVKQRAPFEGHYANKKEAKTLRRIMSQTGLTESEVRAIKKYRIMLSEAQRA